MELNDDGARRPGLTRPERPPEAPRHARRGRHLRRGRRPPGRPPTPSTSSTTRWPTTTPPTLLVALFLIPIGVSVFAFRRFQAAEEVWKETARLSMRDALTGLPTRRFLTEHFHEVVRRVQRHGGRVGVFFLDLDKFKQINDTYGHEVGDQVMVRGRRPHRRASSAPTTSSIRYGGDEFVVICPNAGTSPVRRAHRPPAHRGPRGALRHRRGPDPVSAPASAWPSPRSTAPSPTTSSGTPTPPCTRPRPRAAASSPSSTARWPDRITPSTAERRLRAGPRRGPVPPLLPAGRLAPDPAHGQGRGADPLGGPRAGHGQPRRVHPRPRGHRPDRPGRAPGSSRRPAARPTSWAERLPPTGPARWSRSTSRPASWPRPTSATCCASVLRRDRRRPRQHLPGDHRGRGHVRRGRRVDACCARPRRSASTWPSTTSARASRRSASCASSAWTSSRSTSRFVDGLGQSREDTTIIEHVIGMARGLGMVTVAEGVETADQVRYLRSLDCHMAQGFFYSKPQPPSVIDRILLPAPDRGPGAPTSVGRPGRPRPRTGPGGRPAHPAATRRPPQSARGEALGPASSVLLAKPSDRRFEGRAAPPEDRPAASSASRRRRHSGGQERGLRPGCGRAGSRSPRSSAGPRRPGPRSPRRGAGARGCAWSRGRSAGSACRWRRPGPPRRTLMRLARSGGRRRPGARPARRRPSTTQ